jgi:hypothetical protein
MIKKGLLHVKGGMVFSILMKQSCGFRKIGRILNDSSFTENEFLMFFTDDGNKNILISKSQIIAIEEI